MKICTKCNQKKSNSEFRKYKTYTSGSCIDCENEYRKNWRRNRYSNSIPLYERENLIKEDKNRCIRCNLVKPLSQFRKSSHVNTGYLNTCKSCLSISQRASVIVRLYGITINEYETLLQEQNNKCVVCHIDLLNTKQCIDHDHTTGKVRGILCDSCNRGLGLLKDDPKILIRGARYIKAHLKQGELLEPPKKEDQQPSLNGNILEGSTTNSRGLTDNAEAYNGDTSALHSKE